MKLMIWLNLIVLAFTANALASDMTRDEQTQYIKEVAKELRRDLWVQGYEEVNSYEFKVTKEKLDEHVKQESMSRFEEELDREEISALYRCHYKETCELYAVDLGAEYMSGSGAEMIFVLLDTQRAQHRMIRHLIYAE